MAKPPATANGTETLQDLIAGPLLVSIGMQKRMHARRVQGQRKSHAEGEHRDDSEMGQPRPGEE